ncbi:MAG: hypothetical protein M0Q38_16965, partial [Bacteroidales bacterium]|nr:hypothetical protein [Bacteroidales bacterium]
MRTSRTSSKLEWLFVLIITSLSFFAFSNTALAQQIPPELNIYDGNWCNNQVEDLLLPACPRTSTWFSSNTFYMPATNSFSKVVILNFIFVQKDDGTGNFQQGDPEHEQIFNDILIAMNSTLINMNIAACGGTTVDTKIQFEMNKIYIQDTYLWNNDHDLNTYKCPDRYNWYLKDLAQQIDNDPSIPKGIDIFFTCSETAYIANVINNDSIYRGANYACSMFPSLNLNDGSYIHMPDAFIKYYWMKNFATIQYGQPWIPVVYGWYVGSMANAINHELGHSFGLGHEYTCTGHNIMDNAGSSARDFMTDTQIAKIHKSLAIYNTRKFVVCEYSPNDPLEISGNGLIDFDLKLYRDIIINPGVTLSVTCNVLMAPDAKIIIKPGGSLIIDEGIITSTEGCNHFWYGIEVWGNAAANQYPNANGQYQQGYLSLNNATIENARSAVALWHGGMISETGGIVNATNSTFRNNSMSVQALYYTNHHPIHPNIEMDYNASFKNCVFEITPAYLGTSTFYNHINLDRVRGIKFNGCDFSLADGVTGVLEENYGIKARDAGFYVNAICNSNTLPCSSYDKCTFTGFYKGVSDLGTDINPYTFSINNAVFSNNTIGVYVNNIKNQSIIKSSFGVGNNHPYCSNAQGFGIYLDHSTGFAIEENSFTKTPTAPQANYYGLYINETRGVDEVYKNTFSGLSYANYASGKNWYGVDQTEGLAYFCNINTDNYADFYVSSTYPSGIQLSQGDDAYVTGNTFSQNGSTWHFFNGSGLIGYYYCDYCPNENPDDNKIFQITDKGKSFNNQCVSHYGDPSLSLVLSDQQKLETEQQFASNLTNYNSVKTLYDHLVDGGSTEGTKIDIANAVPSDMWALRSKLLGRSPHLSMDVLKEVADKTDVFTESALFDILAANPDELKKEELIKYLEDKENPLPGYMIDILRQVAGGTTYKTVLQQQMAIYSQSKTRAAHDMIRSILNDTVSDFDGLRNWLDNLGGMCADEQIIASYLRQGNYSGALALANTLPGFYHLKGDDLTEHGYYIEMLTLMITLEQEGRTITDLHGNEVETL